MPEIKADLIEQEYSFSGKTYLIKKIKNLDELVDRVDVEIFKKDERLPYWAELWPSAIGLSRHIAANPHLLFGKSVLELGCGLGLTSLVLRNCHPKSLLLTDYEPESLQIASDNFILNGLDRPQTHLLDWRKPDMDLTFERIVASDVLYEERFFAPLLQVLIKYLKPGGMILLAEPGRPIAQPFFEMLQKNHFVYEEFSEMVDQDSKEINVGIYRITKKTDG
jgi:predicted nicotinamide N-methyase